MGARMPETEVVRRAIGLTRTKDFRKWPAAKLLIHPDAQDPLDISFYGACYFPYPGRDELHAMVIPVFITPPIMSICNSPSVATA